MPRPLTKRSPQALKLMLTLREFEAAQVRLPKPARDYFRAGADDELTLADNERAFDRFRLWPRVLVDVSERRLGCRVGGHDLSLPVLVAPMAYQRLAHTQGELALARAAAAAGSLYVASTLSTFTLEEIASVGGPRWFQVYVHKDREVTASLIRRAEAAGYSAIVLTVDVPVLGRRLNDLRNSFALPRGLTMANLAPYMASRHNATLAAFFASRHDASLNWHDLKWLRGLTGLPLWLKGILRPDDARRAARRGVDGIIVSNHGGRQLDTTPATLDALAAIAPAARGTPLLLDGGVRRGTDVVKALALGAQAVLVGRPFLWGLAQAGETGAAQVFEILRDEFDRALALCGCRSVGEIRGDLLRCSDRA